ncbi:CHAT domain-containing protein [Streptomyces sp. HUAS TT20]|uniref:CHAT domain-containing protein n=1 Tax=Streptomyces sp. HUAS TT20 TaxID=3447509 RepID=UPI0021DB36B4|nr:CHAT domain-containing protein [Streptomyces sp. HUAS 15-9]UXY27238.1 CHAT domain-containing protein [Streptomyces sp. HUAS 15-9]
MSMDTGEPDLLAEMAGMLTGSAAQDGQARGTALAWFSSAGAALSERLESSADAGDDERTVALAQHLVHFLIAVQDWAALETTSRLGLAGAARLGTDPVRMDLLQSLGVALQHQGRDADAEPVFQEVADLATDLDDQPVRASALAHLGQLHHRRGDLARAAALLQQAALAYRTARHPRGEARTSGDLAPLLHALGDPDQAADYSARARRLFHAMGDRLNEARSLRLVAAAQAEAGADEEALRTLRVAVEMFDADGAAPDAAEALHTAARLHRRRGDTPAARAAAREALDRTRATGAPAREMEELHAVLEAEEAVAALLTAETKEERDAAVTGHPALLGGLALQMLVNRRDAIGSVPDAVRPVPDATGGRAGEGRLDAALDHLAALPDGALAEWCRIDWAELCRVAGDNAEPLPSGLSEPLRQRLLTDRPDRRGALLTEALALVPADRHPGAHGLLLAELAQLYATSSGGDPEGHDQSIRLAEQAARLLNRPESRDKWAVVQAFLGSAWRSRPRGNKAENIAQAQRALRGALTFFRRSTSPVEWAATVANLANAYWECPADRTRNLRRALHRHLAALTVFTREDFPDRWAIAQSNIGLVLSEPALAADPDALELGRRHLEQAVRMPELSGPARAHALVNLSRCYRMRLQGDHDANQSTALHHAQQAFALYEESRLPLDMANAATAIADALANTAVRSGSAALDEAVAWYRRGLELAPADEDPLMHASIADNLANTLVQRREVTAEELDTAILLHTTALETYEAHGDHHEAARARYNLAATLRRGDRPDTERAVQLLESSLETRTPDTVPLEWAESATELARAWLTSLSPEGRGDRVARAVGLLTEVVSFVPSASAPDHARRAWGLLGDAHAETGAWPAAADAYERALEAAENLYRITVLPGGKEAELVQTADLPREAAHALVRAGRPERAVAVMEQSRARDLGDRLQRDRVELDVLGREHPDVVADFRSAVRRVRTVEARRRADRGTAESGAPRRLRAAMTDAQAQLTAATEAVRALPGFHDFLRSAPMAAVRRAVADGPPLVYLITARHGSVALLVQGLPEEPGIRIDVVQAPLSEPELLLALAAHPSLEEDEDLRPLLDLLGTRLMAPLAKRLRSLDVSRVVLVTTGILGVLPVHAARIPVEVPVEETTRCLFDDVAVSYTPSARVLIAARTTATEHPYRTPRLLGVAEPHPCEPPLPWAGPELDAVRGLFTDPGRTLTGADATKENLLQALPAATHLHFAGHGYYDSADPVASSLELADGDRLTLRELLDGQALAGIRLVVASACRTAVTDMTRLPDEAIGLPAGLVQSGAAGVVGSLWEVNDRSTALLIARFYAYHLLGAPEQHEPPMPPAVALARAQSWLRDADTVELNRFAASVGLRRARATYAERPSHWAAFVLVGEG